MRSRYSISWPLATPRAGALWTALPPHRRPTRMQFFIDSADVGEIKKAMALGLCDGVTTNPSLVAKTGRAFGDVLKEIVALVPGPISAEVTATDAEGMLREARQLAKYGPQVVIKIPLIVEGLRAVKDLAQEG